jgi:hypothetical protein
MLTAGPWNSYRRLQNADFWNAACVRSDSRRTPDPFLLVMQLTGGPGLGGATTALNKTRIYRCALCGRRANAHGSVRRRRRDQIAGQISPAPGAANCSAVVKVELGPARIRASLTGAPDRDNAVRVWSFI